jgi:hypothetical protein
LQANSTHWEQWPEKENVEAWHKKAKSQPVDLKHGAPSIGTDSQKALDQHINEVQHVKYATLLGHLECSGICKRCVSLYEQSKHNDV